MNNRFFVNTQVAVQHYASWALVSLFADHVLPHFYEDVDQLLSGGAIIMMFLVIVLSTSACIFASTVLFTVMGTLLGCSPDKDVDGNNLRKPHDGWAGAIPLLWAIPLRLYLIRVFCVHTVAYLASMNTSYGESIEDAISEIINCEFMNVTVHDFQIWATMAMYYHSCRFLYSVANRLLQDLIDIFVPPPSPPKED
jgi:hypothetical protein